MWPAIVVVAATMSDDLARDTPSAPPTHHRPWVGVVTSAALFLECVPVPRGGQGDDASGSPVGGAGKPNAAACMRCQWSSAASTTRASEDRSPANAAGER